MNLKKILFSIYIISIFSIFAEDLQGALERIRTIEDTKAYMLDSGENQKHLIEFFEQELKNTPFSELSNGQNFTLTINNYNLKEQGWELELNLNAMGQKMLFNTTFILPYSTVTGSRFLKYSEMTSHQKNEYESNVEDWEQKFRSGKATLYAEIHFTVTPWIEASQYKFSFNAVTIYRNDRITRTIYTHPLNIDCFVNKTPRLEIRTPEEIQMQRAQLAHVQDDSSGSIFKKTKKFDQKKRRTLYLTLDQENTKFDFFSDEITKLHFDNLNVFLTFGITRFYYAGLSVAYDIDSINSTSVYSFEFLNGINYTLFNHFRPYLQGSANLKTDNTCTLKAGTGIDLILDQHLMFTCGWNYNWNYDTYPIFFGKWDEAFNRVEYQTFEIGLGINW